MQNKFDYILKIFKTIFGIQREDVNIHYGIDDRSKIQIKKGRIEYFLQKNDYDLNKIIYKEWQGFTIPFLFDYDDSNEIFTFQEDQLIINYDIIAAAFFFLSGWQEFVTDKKDAIGRFPFTGSIQHKLGIAEIPVVNYYFDILKNAIERMYRIQLKSNIWGRGEFAACITHDIDKCESAWLEGSFRELLRGNLGTPFQLIIKKLSGNDAWFNFDEILAIEKKFNIRSSFYFLCNKKRSSGFKNADYDITEKKFLRVFEAIVNQGSEIGIHGSSGTHTSVSELKRDIERCKYEIAGNRFHYLLFDTHQTPAILERAGVRYDTSLGFAENIGFRNSCCFPFFLYDLENNRMTNVLEIPLVLMDVSLLKSKYMNLNQQDVLSRVAQLINEIKKFHGCLTILWHNNSISDVKYAVWKETFIQILELCQREHAVFLSGKEIFDFYVKRYENFNT